MKRQYDEVDRREWKKRRDDEAKKDSWDVSRHRVLLVDMGSKRSRYDDLEKISWEELAAAQQDMAK